ncbi:MarR family winged helix-turn-helix transcriptional regulator [Rhodoplanes roseus]|uniref:MarR family winged helix-turn-helix transcriptional regulator n=1 Tax=Rhodoplanes roseus TaxID=29409 RepID=UPI0011B5C2B3|nr:helix-turn-helix domain-containing protein [Rhodoplanes roseus]
MSSRAGGAGSRRTGAAAPAREGEAARRAYFRSVADTRFIVRKIFRMIEAEAKRRGIDPMAHQALLQIHGSPDGRLRVNEVAARLDVSPSFASSLVKQLVAAGLAATKRAAGDPRATDVAPTRAGIRLLHEIDAAVAPHIGHFAGQLDAAERAACLAILGTYVGRPARRR